MSEEINPSDIITLRIEDLMSPAAKIMAIIGSTMGAHSKNVTFLQGDEQSVNDGLTVLKLLSERGTVEERFLSNRAISAANRTVRKTGDGTSTAAVLFLLTLLEGVNTKQSVSQIESDFADFLKKLGEHKMELDNSTLLDVALTVTHGNRDVALPITQMVSAIGSAGNVTVSFGHVSSDAVIETDVLEGIHFAPMQGVEFATQGGRHANEQCLVVGSLEPITDALDLSKITALYMNELQRVSPGHMPPSLVIIAPEIGGAVKATLSNFRTRDGHKLPALAIQDRGPYLEQRLRAMGLQPFSRSLGRNIRDIKEILTFGTVISDAKNTSINCDPLPLDLVVGKNQFDSDEMARVEKAISGKIGHIRVNSKITQSEWKHLMQVIDDAVRATQSALSGGVVYGGGVSLCKAWGEMEFDIFGGTEGEEERIQGAVNQVLKAYLTIIGNEYKSTYPLKATDSHGDQYTLYDGLDVWTAAVESAVSEAGLLLNTKYFIV